MLTDSCLYDAQGTIIGFDLKAYPVDSWTGIITGRANWWGPTFVRDFAESFGSFDEFLSRSAATIEREHREALATGQLAGQTFIEVHAVGWSEHRDRPEAYVLRSPSVLLRADEPPYVWRSLEDEDGIFHHARLSARELWQLHRQGAEEGCDFDAETFDPMEHGIPLVEAQRRKPASPDAGEGIAGKHVIGGDLWLSVVDREGVRQGVIRKWGDQIGEPIQPEPLDEDSLPEVLPTKFDGSCTFSEFMDFIKGGLIDPESFEWDEEHLKRIQALAAGVPLAEIVAADLAKELPADAGPRLSRRDRRVTKAQARKPVRVR